MTSDARIPPKDRRTVLEQLTRDRLAELTMRLELEVEDRRSTEAHIDAIIRKRGLEFGSVLEQFKREELQAACEALGLDGGGREKSKLVERILARSDGSSVPDAPTSGSLSEATAPEFALAPSEPSAAARALEIPDFLRRSPG